MVLMPPEPLAPVRLAQSALRSLMFAIGLKLMELKRCPMLLAPMLVRTLPVPSAPAEPRTMQDRMLTSVPSSMRSRRWTRVDLSTLPRLRRLQLS
jgi:hypothetical protein